MFEYLDTLNDEQKKAVKHTDGPLLIIAGAGSGKTTTLVNRVAYMVDNGVLPENILLLTFTNAAADNMKTRASKLSNPECGKITASTYHSFCAEVLREYGAFIKLKKDFTIITPQEELEVFKLCKSELKYGSYRGFPKAKDVMEVVSLCLNKLWDVDYAIEDIFANIGDTNIEAVKKTIERMGTYKEENHMLSYDDLLVKMYELLQNEDVRNILERRYKYVMVDEYQDTNKIQEKIVFLLTRDNKNLVVVGDDYQSIYKFRGSEIENIIEFPNRVGGCEQVVIDTNYRSNKEILDVANEVMRDNADFGYPKFMKNTGKSGDKVKFVRPGRCEDEANLILASIKAWRDAGKNMSEYAVLERKSKSSSALEVKLTSEGIEYEKLGGLKFLEHQCVLDMLSFFKVVTNNDDELSWFHILDILPGIGEVYAHRVMNDLKNGTLSDANSPWKQKSFYGDLLELTTFVKEMEEEENFEKMFQKISNYYFAIVKKKIDNMKTPDEENRLKAYEQMEDDKETVGVLFDIAMKYDNAIQFLDSIVLDATTTVPTEGKVIISTIHSSKGMEWEHVDLMDCLDGITPTGESHEEDMEDLRCLYVALTRAKEEEVIYAPYSASICGKVYNDVSPFLKSSLELHLLQQDAYSASVKSISMSKIYLNVNFYEKETAKNLGAKWDNAMRCWFIPEGHKNEKTLLAMYGKAYIR